MYLILFVGNLLVAQNDAGDIGTQIAVAADKYRQHIGQNRNGSHKNGIEAGRFKSEPPQEKDRADCQNGTNPHPVDELGENHVQHSAGGNFRGHHGKHNGSHQVCHRVVTAAFHFQQRSRSVFQIQLFGTEYGKDGGGICRAKHCPHEHALQPAGVQSKPAEHAHSRSCEEHAQSGQQHRFSGNWFCRTPFGAESAVKDDKDQGDGTEGFRQGIVVETDMQRTVHAAEHTHSKKCQQHGHADLTGQLVAENTGDHH